MSWAPNDLVTDLDLRDYEEAVLSSFGQTTWQAKRTKALEDWLFPILRTHGFDPYRLRTRYEPDAVLGYTGAVYTDRTAAAVDATVDDLPLATIFATPASDALYIGSTQPFRGVSVRVQDTPSAVSGVLSVAYWTGAWTALLVADGTAQTAGVPFSGGGAVTWLLPVDWTVRAVNSSVARYWVKVTISATPTGATIGQLGVIRQSALRAPATYRTLQLIMAEAPTGAEGPWAAKQAFYEREATTALQRALQTIGGEFDTDASDTVSPTEAAQTADSASGGAWGLQRA
jgi:hypothetical protein